MTAEEVVAYVASVRPEALHAEIMSVVDSDVRYNVDPVVVLNGDVLLREASYLDDSGFMQWRKLEPYTAAELIEKFPELGLTIDG